MTMNDEYLILGKKDCHIQIVDFTTGETLKFTQELAGETVRAMTLEHKVELYTKIL
jgi:hypothetical protein